MKLLSINFGHDASLCIFADGVLVDFCEVERESRLKHHFGLTSELILRYLGRVGMSPESIDLVTVSGTQEWGIFHSKDISISYGYTASHQKYSKNRNEWNPDNFAFNKGYASSAYGSHVQSQQLTVSPGPIRVKWNLPFFPNLATTPDAISQLGNYFIKADGDKSADIQSNFLVPLTLKIQGLQIPGFFVDHHAAHAYYAGFYSSDRSIVVTHDGGVPVAPFCSGGIYLYDRTLGIYPLMSHRLTLGYIYDQVATKFNLDAGKLMGLASYGHPNKLIEPVIRQFSESLYSVETPNPGYTANSIVNSANVDQQIRRRATAKFQFKFENTDHAIQAATNAQHLVQRVYVEQVGAVCEKIFESLDGFKEVYMTGGFSLNCPSNTSISHEYPFMSFRPLPGVADTGLSLGAAVAIHYFTGSKLDFAQSLQPMSPAFPPSSLIYNDNASTPPNLRRVECSPEELPGFIAEKLIEGRILCLHRGRSEVGPRALGHRSIIAWAGIEELRDKINRSKGRESWRPLAPICSIEDFHDYFVGDPEECRFMLTVSKVKTDSIPAITHVDFTARVQVIDQSDELLHSVLKELRGKGAAAVIVNTSFNCSGEPLVETFSQATRSFLKMGFDYLVSETGVYEATDSK